jgi:hypothetical protein
VLRTLTAACLLVAACTGTAPAPVRPPLAAVPTTPPPSPTPAPTPAPSAAPVLLIGGDISWPSCPVGTTGALPKRPGKGLPLPAGRERFVVLGLTNGPGFYPNPCLAWEVQEARRRGLAMSAYAFTTMPNASQVKAFGGLVRAVREEVRINVASMRSAGLRTPIVWIDVEPQSYLEPWGTDTAVNRLVIRTAQAAYRAAGFRTGLYSSDTPWKHITGGMRDDGPTWVTVGPRGEEAARTKCAGPTFSGGPALMAQWWDDETQDKDLVCPGEDAEPLFAR